MKKKTFMINALILTGTSFINMMIGMFFRVYMSNKIGAEGIGLYQLVTAVYFFAATFSTTGISLTVTRLVTDFIAQKQYSQAKKVVAKCLALGVGISIFAAVIMFIFAEQIGINILKDARTILSLQILAPSLPFVAISSCFRGYFYAVRRVIKTASEQLFEQIIEIVVFMILIGNFAPRGIEYACAAVVIGTTLSEILSCVYSYLLYINDVKKIPKAADKYKKGNLSSNLFLILLPLTASASLRAGLSTLENILIPSGLKRYGASSTKALYTYGLICGMVMPIIAFPALILMSFSMLLIPEMSEANAINQKANINYIAEKVLKVTLIFSIMIMNIFLFFSKDLCCAIYSNSNCSVYLSIFAPLVPLMYLDKIVDGMLKGLNQQMYYLSYNIIDSSVRVLLIFILLPFVGIKGFIIMTFVSTILNSSLSVVRLLKVTCLKFNFTQWVIGPLICSTISGIFVKFMFANNFYDSTILKMILEFVFSIALYITLLIFFCVIKKSEMVWLKKLIHLTACMSQNRQNNGKS